MRLHLCLSHRAVRLIWAILLVLQAICTTLIASRPVTGACTAESWPARFDQNGHWEQGLVTRTASDGSVYVSGTVDGRSALADTALFKYDSTGTLLWSATYEGPFLHGDTPCGIGLDASGNVYLAGTSQQYVDDAPSGEVFILKYNASGQRQWLTRYNPGPSWDIARSMVVAANGDSFVHLEHSRAGVNQAITIKCDPAGQIIWESRHDLHFNHFAGTLMEGEPGTLYSISTTNAAERDPMLVKYSQATGAKLWTRALTVGEAAIGCYATGGPVIATKTSQPSRIVVTRFAPDGDVAWTSQAPADFLSSIAAAPDGSIYVDQANRLARWSAAGTLEWNVPHANTGGSFVRVTSTGDAIVTGFLQTLRMSSGGSLLWSRYFAIPENSAWNARALELDQNDNIYVTGGMWIGDSDRSDMVTFKFNSAGQTVPETPAPGGLRATAVSLSQIDLVWADQSSNETGFAVERSTPGTAFALIDTLPAGATSYSSYGLDQDTTYTYRVSALAEECPSGYSNSASATTPVLPPNTPVAPVVVTPQTLRGQRVLEVSWTAPRYSKTIVLERASGENAPSGFAVVDSFPAGTPGYANGSLQPNSGYTYRIKAVNSAGSSGYSPTASGRTLALTGGKLKVPATLSFPNTRVGTTRSKALKIQNKDKLKPLRVEIQQAPVQDGFQISGVPLAFTIPPKGSSTVNVVYVPAASGSTSASLIVRSDDPTAPSVMVALKGRAQAPRRVTAGLIAPPAVRSHVEHEQTAARSLLRGR